MHICECLYMYIKSMGKPSAGSGDSGVGLASDVESSSGASSGVGSASGVGVGVGSGSPRLGFFWALATTGDVCVVWRWRWLSVEILKECAPTNQWTSMNSLSVHANLRLWRIPLTMVLRSTLFLST